MSEALKALSIQQPWGWLIAAGHKDVENRSWPTQFGGRFLIHVGKKYEGHKDDGWGWPEIAPPAAFDMGGIIGEAEIIDCVTSMQSPWFFGSYSFVIRNARLLPFQPCRGMLGFFTPDFSPASPKPTKPPRQSSLFGPTDA